MPERYSAREVIRVLEKAGFEQVHQRGSHIKLRKESLYGVLTPIIPNYKEISPSVFSSILRQARMSKEEFEGYLKK